jgi:hypothetical protein
MSDKGDKAKAYYEQRLNIRHQSESGRRELVRATAALAQQ